MRDYGFTFTVKGRALLASLLAGERLEITRIMVGSGMVPEDESPVNFRELVNPVAAATSTLPAVKDNMVSFVVEYRSDLNGGLEEGFWLREFGIFALDKSGEEILLYYATLGDYPQYVSAYGSGSVDIRRFPITIVVSTDTEVVLDYPALAFMTAEEIGEYATSTLLPELLAYAEELIKKHNEDPEAHPEINRNVDLIESRVKKVEDMLSNDVTRNSFTVSFVDLVGITVKGVWNQALQRIEF